MIKQNLLEDSLIIHVVKVKDALIKFISGREVTIKDVLHNPKIFKNLVFDFFLNKYGFKKIIEVDQYILFKKIYF